VNDRFWRFADITSLTDVRFAPEADVQPKSVFDPIATFAVWPGQVPHCTNRV